ncbi:MAG: hypothetical protein IKF01_01810 [Bacilli bacterium]|nr:hypothetical protein [Bacilli bacterium]
MKYESIINMPHHVSYKRSRMSIYERSAQFAPFAALTGYSDLVCEVSRKVESKKIISEDKKEEINSKLKNIIDRDIEVIYFVKDKYKNGGMYIDKKGTVKKIDLYLRKIILYDKTEVPIDDIFELNYH